MNSPSKVARWARRRSTRCATVLSLLVVGLALAPAGGDAPFNVGAVDLSASPRPHGVQRRRMDLWAEPASQTRVRHLIIGLGTLGTAIVKALLVPMLDESHQGLDPATHETFTLDSNPNDGGPGGLARLRPDLVLGEVDMGEIKRGRDTVHRDLAENADLEAAPDGVFPEARQNKTVGLSFGWRAFDDIARFLASALARLLNGAHGAAEGGAGHRQVLVTMVTGCGGTGTSMATFLAVLIKMLSGGNVRVRLILVEPLLSARDRWAEEVCAATLREAEKDRELTRASVEHTVLFPRQERPARVARAFDAVMLVQERNCNGVGVGGRDGLARAAAGIVRTLCFTPMGTEWNAAQENIPDEAIVTADGQTVVPVVEAVWYERIVWDARGLRARSAYREVERALRYLLGQGDARQRAHAERALRAQVPLEPSWTLDRLGVAPLHGWQPADELVDDRKQFPARASRLAHAHLDAVRLDVEGHVPAIGEGRTAIEESTRRAVLEVVEGGVPLGAVRKAMDALRLELSRFADLDPHQRRTERMRTELDLALADLRAVHRWTGLLRYRKRAHLVVDVTDRLAQAQRQLDAARVHGDLVVRGAQAGLDTAERTLVGRADSYESAAVKAHGRARAREDRTNDRFVSLDPGRRELSRPSDVDRLLSAHRLETDAMAGTKLAGALAAHFGLGAEEPSVDHILDRASAAFLPQFDEALASTIREHLPRDPRELQRLLLDAYDRAAPRIGLKNGGPEGVKVCHLGLPGACRGLEAYLPGVDRVVSLDDPYEIIVFRGVHQVPLASIDKYAAWTAKLDAMEETDYRCTRLFPRWWSTRQDRLQTLCRAVLTGIVRPDATGRNYREYAVNGTNPDEWTRISDQVRGVSWRAAVRAIDEDDAYAERLERSLGLLSSTLGHQELLARVEAAARSLEGRFPQPAWRELRETARQWMDSELADAYRFRGGSIDGTGAGPAPPVIVEP